MGAGLNGRVMCALGAVGTACLVADWEWGATHASAGGQVHYHSGVHAWGLRIGVRVGVVAGRAREGHEAQSGATVRVRGPLASASVARGCRACATVWQLRQAWAGGG